MKSQNIDYLGVTEIKKKGKGFMELREGYWLYWSGVGLNERGAEGVGLVVKPDKIKNIREERYNSGRLLIVDVKIDDENIWTLIVAYAPNDNARKDEKDEFFEMLQIEIYKGRRNNNSNGRYEW